MEEKHLIWTLAFLTVFVLGFLYGFEIGEDRQHSQDLDNLAVIMGESADYAIYMDHCKMNEIAINYSIAAFYKAVGYS